MKRQLIIGLILVLLIGVCFGAYFGVDYYQTQKEEKAAEEAAALQLSSFDSDAVTKLVIHTPELDYTIDKDDNSQWQVAEGDAMHIKTYYIDALCTYGCSLTATKDLGTADSDKLKTYGLSDPISITYYTSDADKPEKTLYIGGQNPTKSSFYVMQDDDDHVYLADANTAGYLYVTKTQISLPSTEYAINTYYIIASAEASSNLARFDGVKYGFRAENYDGLTDMYEKTRSEGFGDEVKRRIMLGTFVLSSGFYDAYYKKAKLVQRRIGQEFAAAFQDCDVILTPTAPSAAFKIGENIGDPLKMYYSDVCTVTVNIAGLPAVSVPCGKSASGLPLGMQLIGNKFAEQTILNAAYGYEQLVGGFHAIAETL